MDEAMIERLERSFALLAPRGEEVVARFYAHLFATQPRLRHRFPIELADEKRRFLEVLVLVVKNLRCPDGLRGALADLGRLHTRYDTASEDFPIFGDALVGVMTDVAGDRWNDQFTRDWTALLESASAVTSERRGAGATVVSPGLA